MVPYKEVSEKKVLKKKKRLFEKSCEVVDIANEIPPIKRVRNKFALQKFLWEFIPYLIWLIMLVLGKIDSRLSIQKTAFYGHNTNGKADGYFAKTHLQGNFQLNLDSNACSHDFEQLCKHCSSS